MKEGAIIRRANGYSAVMPDWLRHRLTEDGVTPDEIGRLDVRAYPMLEGEQPRKTDIYSSMLPFLDDPESLSILEGSLRTADLTIGCVPREGSPVRCDTCLADSPEYRRGMDNESLIGLISDVRFPQLLQSSFRLGSGADPLDHPHIVKITETLLQNVVAIRRPKGHFAFPADRKASERVCKKLKIVTTYRPRIEDRLLGLVSLANKYPDRVELSISMPFNVDDSVQKAFAASDNRFVFEPYIGQDVKDLARNYFIAGSGRTIDPSARVMDGVYTRMNNPSSTIGSGKLFLNPDGLWIMLYLAADESHTVRGYIHIDSPDKLKRLARVVPYNKDFDFPPGWPAGSGSALTPTQQRETSYAFKMNNVEPRQPTTISY